MRAFVCGRKNKMRPRTALPLVLLFASGCAQVPADGEVLSNERPPVAQAALAPTPPALVTEVSAAPPAAPAAIAAPKLQPAAELAVPAPAVEASSKSLWP